MIEREPEFALRAPVKVLTLDVDHEAPGLPADVNGYPSALIFLSRGGAVLADLTVDLTDRLAASDQLRARIAVVHATPAAEDHRSDAPLTPVSVVIPSTLERTDGLARCLRSLAGQSHVDFEVIVVDNRPENTAERKALIDRMCAIDTRIRFVDEPFPGISAARNRGVAHASADIIAFTDDDVEVTPHWLRAIAARFAAEPDTSVVTGLVLPAELETQAQIWFERSGGKVDQQYELVTFTRSGRFTVTPRYPDGRTGPDVPIYRAKFGMGANMAFRAEALANLRGFDVALGAGTQARGGEDIVAISRTLYAGRTLTIDPTVQVRHYHRNDYDALRRQMYGYGVGYTAAITALIRSDVRHLLGFTGMTMGALRLLGSRSRQRVDDDFPADLSRTEMRGLAIGPYAYLRGRIARGSRTVKSGRALDRRSPASEIG